MPIDLRQSLNAISDVVNNRPRPLREFDQIFMKSADMLLQTEHVGRHLDGRRVVCIGDGDAIGLCLIDLHNQGLLEKGPKSLHVLDFDERVIMSVQRFAQQYGITERITGELYNVADPLPEKYWQHFDGFYTNPPFGASNGGRSVDAFIQRGLEAVGQSAIACIVIADNFELPWTQSILLSTQRNLNANGYVISELIPRFHGYHLDDEPELKSCSLVARQLEFAQTAYNSLKLDKGAIEAFYGEEAPLRTHYVRDNTNGGRLPSKDYRIEPMEET